MKPASADPSEGALSDKETKEVEKDVEEKATTIEDFVGELEGVSPSGTSIYTYRDFSNVAEEELEEVPASTTPPSRAGVETSIRVQKFPVKLYAILAQKEFNEVITWQPHGRAWKVLKPQAFETLVMPLFFEYSNYHSFNRLVNAWSFRRISSGPDRGSYYHELFLRGKPHLQKFMRRLPKTHKKLPMKKEDEPDFYDSDKISPLPSLEESPLPSTSVMPPMKRPLLGGGPRPPLTASNAAIPPSMGMDTRDLGMAPSFAMTARLGGLGAYGSMGPFGPGGFGGMGLGGFSGFGRLGPGSGLGPQQMAAANLSFNNPAAMGSPSQFERIRRLQELEAMERHVLSFGQRR
eukprot:scaffold3046_cov105-Cylindrotheca_fusiformis.AAC.8